MSDILIFAVGLLLGYLLCKVGSGYVDIGSLGQPMPYGMAKDVGGDSPKNDSIMEKCVANYTSKGMSKQEAIKRCKGGIQNALRRAKSR